VQDVTGGPAGLTAALAGRQDAGAGQADAALIFSYDDTTPDDIRATHLFDDPMYLLSLEPGQSLLDHRESAWIAGCEHCRREFADACEKAGIGALAHPRHGQAQRHQRARRSQDADVHSPHDTSESHVYLLNHIRHAGSVD
jgi:hypothetical protein